MKLFESYLKEDLINEAEIKFVKGSDLTPEQQKEVKSKYVHRHTGNNKPAWAKETWKDGKPYPLHFKDDKEWLENTTFGVTKTGKLHSGTKYCNSSPTYPNNPELRKQVKESVDHISNQINESNISKLLTKFSEGIDWKDTNAVCPKCKAKDIKSLSMDKKKCNSCKHEWDK